MIFYNGIRYGYRRSEAGRSPCAKRTPLGNNRFLKTVFRDKFFQVEVRAMGLHRIVEAQDKAVSAADMLPPVHGLMEEGGHGLTAVETYLAAGHNPRRQSAERSMHQGRETKDELLSVVEAVRCAGGGERGIVRA